MVCAQTVVFARRRVVEAFSLSRRPAARGAARSRRAPVPGRVASAMWPRCGASRIAPTDRTADRPNTAGPVPRRVAGALQPLGPTHTAVCL